MISPDSRGARWWKFDFHSHTPASEDYGKGPAQASLKERRPKDWLLDYMNAGIDCVAITDHNSGGWIDVLKEALADLKDEKHPHFRDIHIFPGVEISVNGGLHILAIFGKDKAKEDIDGLLHVCGFSGRKGSCEAVTQRSPFDVVKAIYQAGAIAIPAHVDKPSGLFERDAAGTFKYDNTTLCQLLDCDEIMAMEIVDASSAKPQTYIERKRLWTEIVGSDSHHPTGKDGARYPGSHFTWCKMGMPSIDGLRLALLDGSFSVGRSDTCARDPNLHSQITVNAIEVNDAKYMGRGRVFRVPFSPWLSAMIGGRGTGKSTLLEFTRLALDRMDEIPDALRGVFLDTKRYMRVVVTLAYLQIQLRLQ